MIPSRILVVGGLVLMLGTVTTVAAGLLDNQSKSIARPVAGSDVGPSGQTGQITYLDNTGEAYRGDAEEFGPFRLMPPGTKHLVREYPADTAPRDFRETYSRQSLPSSKLLVLPPAGWSESAFRTVLRNGIPIEASGLWASPDGRAVSFFVIDVPDWALPIDVYLGFPDSLTVKSMTTISTHPAIVEGPNERRSLKTPPPPPGGSVRVYVNGVQLILQSDDLEIEELTQVAKSVIPVLERN